MVLPFALADDGASLTSRLSQRASTRLLASRTRPSSSGVEAQHFQQAPGASPEAGDGEAEVLVGRFSFVSRVASQCPHASAQPSTLNPQPSTLLKGSDPLEGLLPESDIVVVSAGSSVGARDETAAAIASLGEPGIWCHGLALRPGKPTLLADCGGVPVIGLPGNPRSALVVFRLIGMPIVRQVSGCTDPPQEPTVRARLERDLPSAAGRLDVVQVRVAGGEAIPLFGSSSLLSILTAADGYVVVPEAATGLAAGSEVEVMLYR
jgi:molybdopterin molybdotransferase